MARMPLGPCRHTGQAEAAQLGGGGVQQRQAGNTGINSKHLQWSHGTAGKKVLHPACTWVVALG